MLTINNTLDGYLKNVEIKGNTVQDTNNLADIKSVGDKIEGQDLYEIPLLSVGKNLLKFPYNQHEVTNNGLTYKVLDGGSIVINGTSTGTSDLIIKVESDNFILSNGSYVFNIENARNSFLLFERDDCGYKYGNNIKFDVTNRTSPFKYIRLRTNSGITYSNVIMKIMLEEGTQATPYEPYKEDKLTILSPCQLEKVGDVADMLVEIDGVWGIKKNIVERINSDSVYWGLNPAQDGATTIFAQSAQVPTDVKARDVLSPNFICPTSVYTISEDEGLGFNSAFTNVQVRIKKDKLTELSANGVKAYMLGKKFKYATTTPQFIPLPHSQQVKLRTFAPKTNILSLCEIPPTIKGDVAKSLGGVVNVHTQEIDNIHQELERVKKLEESTISIVKNEGKDFVSVEATNGGYFEDVVLSGKTLVSLDGATQLVNTDIHKRCSRNVSIATIVNNSNKKIYLDLNNLDGTYKTSITVNANTPYLYKSNNDVIKLLNGHSNYGWLTNEVDYFKTNCFILEGDHTQAPPSYFEGLASVGEGTDEIVVSTTWGEGNLWKDSNIHFGDLDSTTGEIKNNAPGVLLSKDLIRITSDVLFSRVDDGSTIISTPTFFCFNKDKKMIGTREEGHTLPSGTQYIRVRFSKTGFVEFNKSEVKVYLGNKPFSSYIPHKTDEKRLSRYNPTTQTWEKPILREWDIVEKRDGKYWNRERSVEVVLDGSENWNTGTEQANTIRYQLPLNSIKTNSIIICDKFNQIVGGTDTEGISNHSTNNVIQVTLNKDKGNIKTWLQSNNLTVIFQAKEEKVYECTNIDLITYPNTTHLTVKSGVLVPNITAKYHGTISNIVNLLQKKVSLLETNMSNYMIKQNRIQLHTTYGSDRVTFKVDTVTMSDSNKSKEEIDYDLFDLMMSNIIVGVDNYNRLEVESMMDFYVSIGKIDYDMWDELWVAMELQHNPPVEEVVPEVL
ncbi:MAG: hypothetical protein ACRDDY_06240 [Clostridium sp.]|uniref:hypothetical protein n=1 Tax=Clostridium sp. TaxID=1506 RepID=UPI003EE74BA1